ncbi:MAG: hypothetical protein H8D23_01415 [Candidatus Brocadiales bacterium]|nr:hypothetical protein [Candidatus Brocadiales bacterium]
MARIIQNRGEIHRWDLVDEAKLSINDYGKLKSYFERKYANFVQYSKGTQMWLSLVDVPIKTQEKMTEQEAL